MSTIAERSAAYAASEPLARALGQLPPSKAAERRRIKAAAKADVDRDVARLMTDVRRWPRFNAVAIHDEVLPGILDHARADSRSRPGHIYALVRSRSGWQHADMGCEAWLIRGTCHHVEGLNMETALVPVTGNVLALIDAIEDEEITAAIGKEVQRSWVYEFPQGNSTVRGLSSTGVEQAARELAKQGEAIRELDVKIEYEDENEARFIAQAGRFAISPEGASVLLDMAIRGKRQSKRIKLRNGGYQDDEHWYEKGITKAVRNAKLALLPESAKTFILAEAVKAGRVKQVENPRQPPPRQAVQAPAQAPRPAPDANCEHVAVFDEKSTLLVCSKCGVVLEEEPGGPSQKPLV